MKRASIIAAAVAALTLSGCDGLWVTAGGDLDPYDYYGNYYGNYYDNPYLWVPPVSDGWGYTWGGPGGNPPPNHVHLSPNPRPMPGGSDGPQHWIPPMNTGTTGGGGGVTFPSSGARPGRH